MIQVGEGAQSRWIGGQGRQGAAEALAGRRQNGLIGGRQQGFQMDAQIGAQAGIDGAVDRLNQEPPGSMQCLQAGAKVGGGWQALATDATAVGAGDVVRALPNSQALTEKGEDLLAEAASGGRGAPQLGSFAAAGN